MLAVEVPRNTAKYPTTRASKATPQAFPLERYEQRMLFQWAGLFSVRYPELDLLFAIPNAGGYTGGFSRNAGRVANMKKEGVKPGVPDICLPVARGGYHALYIEMKRQGTRAKSVSPDQLGWHLKLREAGNLVEVAPGFDTARTTIIAYLESGK